MEIIKEINRFEELYDNSWSGALDTLKDIIDAGKTDELMELLEDTFYGETPTETEVNDFLWFEREYIYESLGLDENGELPSDDDDEDDEDDDEE